MLIKTLTELKPTSMKLARYYLLIIICLPLKISAWDLNDLSYLMPLEDLSQQGLNADSQGTSGPLLPIWMQNKIGGLSNASPSSGDIYSRLRVVSARIDPCPPELSTTSPCRPEIRLVWQPIFFEDFSWNTEDVSIHSFYRLTQKDFNAFAKELLKLRQYAANNGVSTAGLALQVHPAFTNDKTKLVFWADFKSLLLSFIGEKNFYRVTFMKLLVPDNWWKFFSGFEKIGDQWKTAVIPRLGTSEVDLLNDATNETQADTSFFVVSNFPQNEDLRYIVSSSYRKTIHSDFPNPQDLEPFQIGIGASHRLQNPKLTNPHTADCASCHYADAAQNFAVRVFPELKTLIAQHFDKYLNPDKAFNLQNLSPKFGSSKNLRAFGYIERNISIMTRTIHDTAQSAHWMNLNFKN